MEDQPQKPEIQYIIEKTLHGKDTDIQFRFTLFGNGIFQIDNNDEEINIVGKIVDDSAQFWHIFINEDLRKHGVGTAVLTAFEEELSKKGISFLFAVFSAQDSQQVNFLLKKGFHVVPKALVDREQAKKLEIPYDHLDDEIRSDDDIVKSGEDQKSNTSFEGEIYLKKVLLKKELTHPGKE